MDIPTSSFRGVLLVAILLLGGAVRAADVGTLDAEARQLAARVQEIARSSSSYGKKEKAISEAVRQSVVVVSVEDARNHDLERTIDVAMAAAESAPEFAGVIARAAAFSTAAVGVPDAMAQIRAAVFEAAAEMSGASGSRSTPAGASVQAPTDREAPVPDLNKSRITLSRNTSLEATFDLTAQHESNVFLTPSNKVSDTLFTATPGLSWRNGQHSVANGSVNLH